MHRLYVEDALDRAPTGTPLPGGAGVSAGGGTLVITGDEARHALLVKRLEPGEEVEILDGRGGRARAKLIRGEARGARGASAEFEVTALERVPPVTPIVHVYTATPKGDRVGEMIDQLSQAGAASWSPLTTARGAVEPRDSKLLRLERIAISAAKQCGRAHVMTIGSPVDVRGAGGTGKLIVADASGEVYCADEATGKDEPRHLLVGPEGGWTPEELAALRARGARVCRFGPHAMRIETAAVVAVGVVMGWATQAPC